VRKRAVTDRRIEGSALEEKRRWQQHKKEESRQQNAEERKGENRSTILPPLWRGGDRQGEEEER
jgi:hypothetical protein